MMTSASVGVGSARVALVGNPNTGKSTLFNALAGLSVRTGNYPGVTIEKKIGRCFIPGACVIDLIDLPGTYSLAPRSPDELVAVEVLTDKANREPPVELIVCVVNALMLQRNLFLVSQLLELGKPIIVVLNMMDSAKSRGIDVDAEKLSASLGVPVIPTCATKREGIDKLRSKIASILNGPEIATQRVHVLPEKFYETRDEFRTELVQETGHPPSDQDLGDTSDPPNANDVHGKLSDYLSEDYFVERMLLDRDGASEKRLIETLGGPGRTILEHWRRTLSDRVGDATEMECNARYDWAKEKLRGIVHGGAESGDSLTDRIDAVLTHRWWGMIGFVLIMFFVFQSIYTVASWPMDLIDEGTGLVSDLISSQIAPGMLRSLLTDGVIAGVGGVLIFLPQIALLFLFLAILEDCGYMARASFLVDRLMSLFGLSGKSFLPMMSSFACAVPGVMATRVIENRRDRFATIMVAPLMSCSARLPVYLLLISAFIPASNLLGGVLSLPAVVLMAMYAVGVIVAIPVSLVLKWTLLRGEAAPFVMELPDYKMPSIRVVLFRVWEASRAFVLSAGTLIFAATIMIWFAGYWPGDHSREHELERQLESEGVSETFINEAEPELRAIKTDLLEKSVLGQAGHLIEPVVRPLGWDWKIGVGAIASFPAREVIIATLGTIYSLDGEDEEGLIGAIRSSTYPDGTPVYTIPVALSVMVFFALCAQCVSTLLVIQRETNSWRWPILSFSYMTFLAYIAARIFPSIPLFPKPPGTKIPLTFLRFLRYVLFIFSESIYSIFTLAPLMIPA